VVLNNAYDIRKPLSTSYFPSSSPYISNAIGFIPILLSLSSIREKPPSHTASLIRQAIKELGTSEQVKSFFSLIRQNSAKLPPFFGDKGMHMLTFSNWSKANLFNVDFSAAVVEQSERSEQRQHDSSSRRIGNGGGNEGDRKGEGKPVYIQNNQLGLTLPNGFPIIGKDGEGNYWLSGYMNAGIWANIERLLDGEGEV
jgi:hypothetical protein